MSDTSPGTPVPVDRPAERIEQRRHSMHFVEHDQAVCMLDEVLLRLVQPCSNRRRLQVEISHLAILAFSTRFACLVCFFCQSEGVVHRQADGSCSDNGVSMNVDQTVRHASVDNEMNSHLGPGVLIRRLSSVASGASNASASATCQAS